MEDHWNNDDGNDNDYDDDQHHHHHNDGVNNDDDVVVKKIDKDSYMLCRCMILACIPVIILNIFENSIQQKRLL